MNIWIWVILSLISTIFIGAFFTYLTVIIDDAKDGIIMLRNHEMDEPPPEMPNYVIRDALDHEGRRSLRTQNRPSFTGQKRQNISEVNRTSQGRSNLAFVYEDEMDSSKTRNHWVHTAELDSPTTYSVIGTHFI